MRLNALSGGQEDPAGRFAAAAGLGADPAVLVHPGVLFALFSARSARGLAGLQYCQSDGRLPAGLPGYDVSCGGADIGAVQVRPDAGG